MMFFAVKNLCYALKQGAIEYFILVPYPAPTTLTTPASNSP